MSIRVMSSVFELSFGSANRKMVALRLADFADDGGRGIWPTVERIADECEISERTVQRILGEFVGEGILLVVSEGGGGRGSSTRYDFDLDRLKTLPPCRAPKAEAGKKGDTVSPKADEPKGDTGAAKGDTGDGLGCHGDTRTVIEPSGIPQQGAQARGREEVSEDPKKIEAEGWALLKNWPQFDGMPKEPAMAFWLTLPAEERATARRRFLPWLELLKKQGKNRIPAPSTYLREKLWQAVPDPADAPAAPIVAKPFGKLWTAVRLARLVAGAGPLPQPSAFIASLIAQGGEAGERERLAHHARYGFPAVNRMDDAADRFVGHTMRPDDKALERLAEGFERVHAKSDVAAAWKAEHARRGWPWLPDPGSHEWFYFPAGGPDGLAQFEKAVRGEHDGVGQAAAE